ncbi:electron transport complex subunit RsxE [Halanaerobium sp. Z-7514]|uniref:Ion-translocating oxidoreductase complex subunit E n=1 Tax=Halanaerobium polyolivorans TaxID=2886943 RepID=A0AAW4WTA2_9FIRM|nr:electron transport complex subunit RsxE [Halanaerobium polyolivorans]MCC3144216.1 electron transport complex subunit RsxE [Halanaerobium polyolivorans]
MTEKAKSLFQIFKNGLWKENPVMVLVIGMCPTLAVTNTGANGFAMGIATAFVLISSEIVISIIKNLIPSNVRIPSFILIIATFVTFTDYFVRAFFPTIAESLSIFIPLIVVNCLILGRQEAFASKNPTHKAIADAVGMSVGFTWVLTLLGIIREFFGMGSIFGLQLLGEWYRPMVIMLLPGGAFLTLGLMVGIYKHLSREG